jgi:hypothetical protein
VIRTGRYESSGLAELIGFQRGELDLAAECYDATVSYRCAEKNIYYLGVSGDS